MTGRHHLQSGAATGAALFATGILLMRCTDWGGNIIDTIWAYLSDLNNWIVVGIGIVLFFLGLVLPDIDSKTSIIGRYVHLPFKHRTWTHSLWPVIAFAVGSLWVRPLMWLAIGYLVHLFWDSISRSGVCWFYPMPGYIEYSSGAKVKKGHWLKLYSNGSVEEISLVWISFAIAAGLVIAAMIS